MQINKMDQNDAEGLAQIMCTGWYRSVHVKSFGSHRARALLGARAQLVGMTTRLPNHVRGVLKTFGMLPGPMRGLPFDRRVDALLTDHDDVAPIVRPMLAAWRQLRQQIAGLGPNNDTTMGARCGHCSACASSQMLRRTCPTAEGTVTAVRRQKKTRAC